MRSPLLMPVVLISLILSNVQGQAQATSNHASTIRYDLSIKVLPEDRRLEVNGTMRIPAANAPRAFIEFSLSEQMRDLQVEVLKPIASAGVAKVEQTRAVGGWLAPDGNTNNDIVYRVHPARQFLPGEDIELRFSYSGGEKMGVLFYVGPEVSFASAYGTTWYPQNSNHPEGIGSLRISVADGETAIAGGDKRSSLEEEAKGIFIFEIIQPTYFSFASGKYTVIRREGAIPVSVYLLRGRENMPKYLEAVTRMLSVLEKEFGPYRFKEFALVEVPRALAQKVGFNAATLQGFTLMNSNAFNGPPSAINWYGHEFSHEWWPHVFSLKRPGGRFIEETLAEYGGLRVVETIAGPAAAERYRRTGYEADPIYSALEYFKVVGTGIDGKLGDLPADEKFRNVAYNKGFLVWDMLSREIGRTKFQQVLRGITSRYAFRQLTLREFWRAIEAGAGRDLSWFYEQWFERTGAPDFQITWKQEGRTVDGAITQAAPYYRATLEIEIQGDQDQRLVYTVRVRGARTEFRLPVRFRVQSVTLDPHYLVLRWTPEYHAAADATRSRRAISPKP
jgi:Peptidase family M1 domain